MMAIIILACTGGSFSDEDPDDQQDSGAGTAAVSCATAPDGVPVQYRCDCAETSGQCVDDREGFDIVNMELTCDASDETPTLDEVCDVEPVLGRCCTLMNGQWSITYDVDTADAPRYASELHGFWESAGARWCPLKTCRCVLEDISERRTILLHTIR